MGGGEIEGEWVALYICRVLFYRIYVLGCSRTSAPRGRRVCWHIGNVRGWHRYLVCPLPAYQDNRQGY